MCIVALCVFSFRRCCYRVVCCEASFFGGWVGGWGWFGVCVCLDSADHELWTAVDDQVRSTNVFEVTIAWEAIKENFRNMHRSRIPSLEPEDFAGSPTLAWICVGVALRLATLPSQGSTPAPPPLDNSFHFPVYKSITSHSSSVGSVYVGETLLCVALSALLGKSELQGRNPELVSRCFCQWLFVHSCLSHVLCCACRQIAG